MDQEGSWMLGAYDILHFMIREDGKPDGKLIPICGEVDNLRRKWFRRPPATREELKQNPYCSNCLSLHPPDNNR